MLKILHYGLSSNRGGIETYLKKLWDNIDRKNYHFSFLDMTGKDNKPCFYDYLKENGCDFYKVTPRKESFIRNRKELEALFKNNSFDILHFHANTLSYTTPIDIALKYGCKVIIHSRSAGMSYRFITKILHMYNKRRIENKSVIRIGVSELATEWLFGKNSGAQVFNNGIDTNYFKYNEKGREQIRRELGCTNKYVVGHVGTFLPVKNQKFLIDIFERFNYYEADSVLWLVGDGPMQNDIRSYVMEKGLTEKVYFLNVRSDMPEVYSAMDFFVLPSLFEGFPNAILEAQCSGLRCLMSDCITSEIMISEKIERMSLSLTSDEWAKRILQLSDSGADDRGNSFKVLDMKGFSVGGEIKRIQQLYDFARGR